MNILQLFQKQGLPRRHRGECQRCQRLDYLPWATEHGERYCGWCHEKDTLEYARLAGWTPPAETMQMRNALTEAERFMAYFSGETEGHFVGGGMPTECLAQIRTALGRPTPPLPSDKQETP